MSFEYLLSGYAARVDCAIGGYGVGDAGRIAQNDGESVSEFLARVAELCAQTPGAGGFVLNAKEGTQPYCVLKSSEGIASAIEPRDPALRKVVYIKVLPEEAMEEGTPPAPITLTAGEAAQAEEEINKRMAANGGQTGTLMCTLMWDSNDDLDLKCVTPDGEINYGHKEAGGGKLDIDKVENTDEDGNKVDMVENIFFPNGATLAGEYKFYVVLDSRGEGSEGDVPFTVRFVDGEATVVKSFVFVQGEEIEGETKINLFTVQKPGWGAEIAGPGKVLSNDSKIIKSGAWQINGTPTAHSTEIGASAKLAFRGTGISASVYGHPTRGATRVFIDGVDHGTFEASTNTPPAPIDKFINITGLTNNVHVFSLEHAGKASHGGEMTAFVHLEIEEAQDTGSSGDD